MNKLIKVLCCGIIIVAGLFTSCSNLFNNLGDKNNNSSDEKAQLTVLCGSFARTAQTIITQAQLESYKYTLSGNLGTETQTFFDKSDKGDKVDYATVTKTDAISVLPGNWSFTLTAYDGDKEILTDTESAKLESGSNTVAFTLYATTGGTGTVTINLTYPTGKGVTKVTAAVYDSPVATGTVTGSGLTITTATGTETKDKVTFTSSEIPSGTAKYVRFFLYDTNGVCIGTTTDAVYVVNGMSATEDITLANINWFAVSVSVYQNGSEWTNSGKSIVLKSTSDTEKSYTLTADTGACTYSTSVPMGAYNVYAGDAENSVVDTGATLMSKGSATGFSIVNFYTVDLTSTDGVTYTTTGDVKITDAPVLLGGKDGYTFNVTVDTTNYTGTPTVTYYVGDSDDGTVIDKTDGSYTIPATKVTGKITVKVTGVTANKTSEAPTADTTSKIIYAKGTPLIIVGTDSATTVYVDKGTVGTYENGTDTALSFTGNGGDLSEYTVYGGWEDAAKAAETRVTMVSGKIANLYGGCSNFAITGTSTLVIRGGTITGMVSCAGTGSSGTVSGTKSLTLSGAPVIGSASANTGILVSSITNQYVSVDAKVESGVKTIVLIGTGLKTETINKDATSNPDGDVVIPVDTVVVKATSASYVTPGKFVMRYAGSTYPTRQYTNSGAGVTEKDIVIAGGMILPDLNVTQENNFDYDGKTKEGDGDDVTSVAKVDGDSTKAVVTLAGTIFSIYINENDGYFTVPTTTPPKTTNGSSYFDMAVIASDSSYIVKDDADVTTKFTTSAKLCYVQFRTTGNTEGDKITTAAAQAYLRGVTFHKTNATVDVKICLETVGNDQIVGYVNDGNKYSELIRTTDLKPNYFNGSFYVYGERVKKTDVATAAAAGVTVTMDGDGGATYQKEYWDQTQVANDEKNGCIYWNQAYNHAKKTSFNGMTGYLMTITSAPENNFLYYKCFGSKTFSAWLGGSRLLNVDSDGTNKNFDASEWTSNTSTTKDTHSGTNVSTKWSWVCGPEAGKVFYSNYVNTTGAATMYSNWNQKIPETNNNNKNGEETALQYDPSANKQWNDIWCMEPVHAYYSYSTNYYVVEYTPYENNYGTVCTPTFWAYAGTVTY